MLTTCFTVNRGLQIASSGHCALWCGMSHAASGCMQRYQGYTFIIKYVYKLRVDTPGRDRYRRRSPSPRRDRDRYRSSRYSPPPRDSYRSSRRSPPIAPYYNRPRRTPPRHGTTLFVAGLNFVTSERVCALSK